MNKILIVFLLVSYSLSAQLYKKHDWDSDATFYKLTEEEKKLSSFAVKEKYLIEYRKLFGGGYRLLETKQSIIRVNTENGIKRQNRVYIPTRNVYKVIDLKARVIKEDGSTKYLNKEDIKELKDVKNYGSFKIFAIEGLVKNSQLEVIYTLDKHVNNLGSVIVQKDYNVNKAEVIIRKPTSLNIRLKSYNGFPKMELKTIEGNRQAYTAVVENVEAMTDEESATPEANRKKVSYQVSYSSGSDSKLWESLENNIRTQFISIKPKKYKSLTNDYEKYTKNFEKNTQAEIINGICKYVNSNFNIIRERNDQLNNLKNVISKKQATEFSINKVYGCIFNHENINFEFVLSSDRFNHKFDRYFFSNLNLQYNLFYFPDEEKFIEPDYVNTRLGFAPYEMISNNAYFIGNNGARFSKILTPTSNQTVIERNFTINLNVDEFISTIGCEHKVTGYRGSNTRGAYKYLLKHDINEFKSRTCANGIDDADIDTFNVKNEDLSYTTENIPLILDYSYTTQSLIDETGNDLILNIGKIIGPQNEFYQEAERVNPVELYYLMTYKYRIEIKIPDGYLPRGLSDLKINTVLKKANAVACEFVSDYKVENGKIIIDVIESYNSLKMDLKYYDGYKDVVNSAYDFSESKILFEKQ